MPLWTIMICTLEERKPLYEALIRKLKAQIMCYRLVGDIELMCYCDNKIVSTGDKRNRLLESAHGKYVSFIDDDDDISDRYISLLYKCAQQDKDCIALEGIITMNGRNPRRFIHSIRYSSYFEQGGVYFRPPNHLNVVKRDLVKDIKFPLKNYSEDYDWSMMVCRAGRLKTEAAVAEPLYYYRAITKK